MDHGPDACGCREVSKGMHKSSVGSWVPAAWLSQTSLMEALLWANHVCPGGTQAPVTFTGQTKASTWCPKMVSSNTSVLKSHFCLQGYLCNQRPGAGGTPFSQCKISPILAWFWLYHALADLTYIDGSTWKSSSDATSTAACSVFTKYSFLIIGTWDLQLTIQVSDCLLIHEAWDIYRGLNFAAHLNGSEAWIWINQTEVLCLHDMPANSPAPIKSHLYWEHNSVIWNELQWMWLSHPYWGGVKPHSAGIIAKINANRFTGAFTLLRYGSVWVRLRKSDPAQPTNREKKAKWGLTSEKKAENQTAWGQTQH